MHVNHPAMLADPRPVHNRWPNLQRKHDGVRLVLLADRLAHERGAPLPRPSASPVAPGLAAQQAADARPGPAHTHTYARTHTYTCTHACSCSWEQVLGFRINPNPSPYYVGVPRGPPKGPLVSAGMYWEVRHALTWAAAAGMYWEVRHALTWAAAAAAGATYPHPFCITQLGTEGGMRHARAYDHKRDSRPRTDALMHTHIMCQHACQERQHVTTCTRTCTYKHAHTQGHAHMHTHMQVQTCTNMYKEISTHTKTCTRR